MVHQEFSFWAIISRGSNGYNSLGECNLILNNVFLFIFDFFVKKGCEFDV